MKRYLRLLAAALVCGLCALSAGAAGNLTQTATETAIRERLAALEQAWARGDAAYAASEVYGTDAVIQGEGQQATIASAAGVKEVLEHLMADSRQVKLELHSLRLLGPAAAHSWVTWQVTPKAEGEKPFAVRALFVWTKGREGWRIRADMYSLGRM